MLLIGPIPNVIFNMSSLKLINFQDNNLTGTLPLDIHFDLPVLEELYLDGNQLMGHIPSGLWDCRRIQFVSLTENKFTGIIPKKVGNVTLLKGLYLHDNSFTGNFPNLNSYIMPQLVVHRFMN